MSVIILHCFSAETLESSDSAAFELLVPLTFAPDPFPTNIMAYQNVPGLYVMAVFLWVLAALAVGLRFIARKKQRKDFWWDDWMIVASLVRAFSIRTVTDAYDNAVLRHWVVYQSDHRYIIDH